MTLSMTNPTVDDWNDEVANSRQRGTLFLRGIVFFGSVLVFQPDSRIIGHVESADERGCPGTSAQSLTYFNFYAQ